jgi:hypothetical protein
VRGTDKLGNVGEWKPYNFEVGKLILNIADKNR